MNALASVPGPSVREIPLSLLSLAPENVRKTPADSLSDAEIKASIAALGLLENLVVRAAEPGDDGTERHPVIAGGRRLAALQALAAEGEIAADHPVPCLVRAGDADSEEVSLAENVVRVAMHPADQVEAFGKLAAAGQTVATIAARFGTSERIVEQRLRLGNAAPELLDAYRADKIDLEVLKAFAITTDRERQLAVWQQVSAQGHHVSSWHVNRLLTEERVPGMSAVARFVGVDAYEAAGGTVLRDLFANDDARGIWFEDPVLLDRLAMDRLQATADELAGRWKWTLAMTEVAWEDTAPYGRLYPEPAEPTEEERAEIARLKARLDELEALDDDDWSADLEAETVAVETRLEEIDEAVEARAEFRSEDLAVAGCIVTIGRDGNIDLVAGLVKPEDMPDTGQATDSAGHVSGPSVSASGSLRKDPAAEARKEAGVGVGLADDLRSIRTALVKTHLAQDFAAAFDLAVFQAARSVFRVRYAANALDIAFRETADRPFKRMNDEAFADWSPGEAMLEDRSGLALDWMEIEDDGESFAALRDLPQADKEALFAACIARTVNPQLAFEPQARPELEATVARLGIDFAASVRPTADMFWSRIAKGRMLDIAREKLGVSWAADRSKLKKAELAAAMETAFAAGDRPVSLSAEMHAAALAWTPPGFEAFDAGHEDVPPTGDGEADEDPEAADVPADDKAVAEPQPDGSDVDLVATVKTVVEDGVAEILAGAPGRTEPRNEPAAGPGDLGAMIDAVNSMPTADGGPRIIVATTGGAQDAGHAPTNGQDPSGEASEIPEFLRKVH